MAEQPARTVELLAELHLEVAGPAGFTHVHVSGGPQELVVDVDDPVAALRAAPDLRTLVRLARAGTTLPAGLAPGLRVRVRTDGRELGSARADRKGRVHLRPTARGVATVLRATPRAARTVLTGGAVVLLTGVLVLVGSRRSRGAGARPS